MRKSLLGLTMLAVSCSSPELISPVGPGPGPVTSVRIEPSPGSVIVGDVLQLTVLLYDARGRELTDRRVAFVSTNEGVATVDASGLVQGLAEGEAVILAISEGRIGGTTISVLPNPCGDSCWD
jgi:uncharacterized protein YjdB